MTLWKFLVKYFGLMSPLALAVRELEDAQRELLEAQSATEYASALVTYNKARVARLADFVASQGEAQ